MLEYSTLEEDYKGFGNPQFSIEVGGEEIKPEEFPILDLNVTMSAGFDMSTCEITIAGIYNQKTHSFTVDVYDKFKPGKVIDVKMGYTSLKGLFKGYINAISFAFDGQSGPIITIQCLDAKGALVNNKTWKNYGKMDIKQIVEAILKEKCSEFATISTVDSDYDAGETGSYDEIPEIKKNTDDYRYIIAFAKKTNNSFCVIYDKLYFCENLVSKEETLIKLEWGKHLLSFSTEINLSEQIGKVQVNSSDPIKQSTISAEEDSIPASGETGSDMASVVKNKTMLVEDLSVINENQASELAKHKLESHAAQLVTCRGSTIGIPDIKAGEKIEVGKMGVGIDGVYYLTHVYHRINQQGYITTFKGSSSSVKKE
ncbi:MAG: hypothetical protein PHY90_05395 [Desulfitobacteriaceae bacterium]|nr:hypothetical protein [Desulfitobacteriaceae bacterium]